MNSFLAFSVGVLVSALIFWQVALVWSRRKSLSQQRLMRRTKRAEKLAELGTLTGNLAHEIRNPLSIIKVNLKLLSEDITRMRVGFDQDHTEHIDMGDIQHRLKRQLRKIDTLTSEADRLADTLNDFMKYAGRMELRTQKHDINALLEELIDFYEPQAVSQGIQIRPNILKSQLHCQIDADLIKQALLNLFINAVQAMDGNGDLIINSKTDKTDAIIEVIDTGPGIGPEDSKKIFDAYYTTKSGGSGLGLPTCRRIIEEHEGHIELHSEPGKGSSFTISLPLVE